MPSNLRFSSPAVRCWRVAALALAGLVGGCVRVEPVVPPPSAETAEPLVRVGVVTGQSAVNLGGGGSLLLSGPDGGGLSELPPGIIAQVYSSSGGVRARWGGSDGTVPATTLTARPADSSVGGGLVRVNGRDYRGEVSFLLGANGLVAVNALGLEEYVAGVVNAEMGRRPPGDQEALNAQAVVSRTVGLRALGRYRQRGYDLVGTVSDQAYGGALSETSAGWDAVHATRGEVLTYNGEVIYAFFSSTCGGRTAAAEEAFGVSPSPYLRSLPDRTPDGTAYCAISPRFRWHEEWGGERLTQTLRETLPLVGGRAELAGQVRDLQPTGRSGSGRVTQLSLIAGSSVFNVNGAYQVRQLLRPADGGLLRSANFMLQVTRLGGRIALLRADGSGNGHGAGMCQWGAVGRARAGIAYREILAAYFPGTEIRKEY